MNKPRRALFIFPSDHMGGAERVTRMLAREAAKSGFFDRVDCLVLCWPRSGGLDVLEADDKVSLRYLSAPSHLPGLAGMMRVLFGKSYELIFSSHLHINALCSAMRAMRWVHAARLIARESTTFAERNFGARDGLIRLMHRLYGRQDRIICQTEFMRRSLHLATSGRLASLLATIPNPVDLSWIAESKVQPVPSLIEGLNSDRRIIVWCGRLVPIKAPLLAIETLVQIHRAGRLDAHLVMIGDGPMRGEIEAKIAQYGLGDSVTLTGHFEHPPAIMTRCHVGLLTSISEGFPNVVLEMLGSGIGAVVSTPCTAALEEIPGVHIGIKSDPSSLANACCSLLDRQRHEEAIPEFLRSRDPRAYFEQFYP